MNTNDAGNPRPDAHDPRPDADNPRPDPSKPSWPVQDTTPGSERDATPDLDALDDTRATDDGDEDGNGAGGGVLQFLRELPVLLGVAFVLAFLLRTFVIQVFYIPSGSMIPTLEINDRIVVEKVTYRFREPRRGEIVVFEGDTGDGVPVDNGVVTRIVRGAGQFLGLVPANARDFVKRVIGLPGDTIDIRDGTVFVNGAELDEPYAVEDLRNFGPFEVPEGKLFFLGDNRPRSSDSRFPSGLGYVDMDHVVGRAVVIIWPFGHFDTLGTPDYGSIPDPGSQSSPDGSDETGAPLPAYAPAA